MDDSNYGQLSNAIRQSQIDSYFSLASVVLLYYEYLLTFDDEIRFFWRRSRGPMGAPWYRINAVTTLFFMNRYLPIAMNVTIIVHNLGNLPPESCNRLYTLDQIAIIIVQLIVGTVTAIRTYALYERSRAVWRLLAGLFLCGLGVGLWSVLGNSGESQTIHIPARFGCHTSLSNRGGRRISAPWIVLIVYDAIVFSLTLWKALEIWKLGSSRLFQILIRDGSIFFFVMTMANLSNVVFLMLAPPFLKDACTAFTSVISVTMVSRLMLNIQNPRLLEEPTTGEYFATADVGTLVTNLVDDGSGFTASSWTLEEQRPSANPVR